MDIGLVYIVAGISSRFGGKIKPLTQITEKETLIEYSLNQAIPSGFTKIIFVVGNKTEQPFKEKFGDNYKGIPIDYCIQKYNIQERDKPWGTAEALCSAKEVLKFPFVVCNGDDIYGEKAFKSLVNHLKNEQTCATIGYQLINSLPENGGVNRAIFKIREDYVKLITETLDISKENLFSKGLYESDLCSMNIFALFPETIGELEKILKNFKEENKEDRKKECYLPTSLSQLIEKEKISMKIYPTTQKCIGITNPGDELKVKEQLKLIK